MELDQNNKLDDFVISRYESFTVPNQKFNQTINYINIERSMKNFFFWNFFGVFYPIHYSCIWPNSKKQFFLKTSKSYLFGTVFISSIWRFLAISWQFSQKNHDEKKIFEKKFFFKFSEITFFEHNLARFEEKIFLKIWNFFVENF